MSHAESNDDYELLALGVLEPEERAEIETHLRENCGRCRAGMRRAFALVAALAGMAPKAEPRPSLRDVVIARTGPSHRSPRLAWTIAAAAAAAAIVFTTVAWMALHELRARDLRVSDLTFERDRLRSLVLLLTNPLTRTAQNSTGQNAPNGRVFVGPDGSVVFIASHFPPISPSRTFELWLIPAKGNPAAAGLFRTQPSGEAVYISRQHAGTDTGAVAVTVEPLAGSTEPTTKPFVIVPLQSSQTY